MNKIIAAAVTSALAVITGWAVLSVDTAAVTHHTGSDPGSVESCINCWKPNKPND